jgi:hypothetical protein
VEEPEQRAPEPVAERETPEEAAARVQANMKRVHFQLDSEEPTEESRRSRSRLKDTATSAGRPNTTDAARRVGDADPNGLLR